MARKKTTVAVLHNQVGEDEYERMRKESPRELDFEPQFRTDVATVAEEIDAVVKALKREGYASYAVNVRDSFDTLYKTLVTKKPDVVFNLIEFFNDEPRQEFMVAGLYELLRIPYTGAPPYTLAICQRKASTKRLLLANGIRTPRFKVFPQGEVPRRHGLHYPLIIKPVREDASAGIDNLAVVDSLERLQYRIEYVWQEFKQPALVEEFIDGRELQIGVLGNDPPEALPVEEFDFSALPSHLRNIVSYEAKWDPHAEAFHKVTSKCPADLPRRVEKKVKEIAVAAFNLMGCRDYARIDMRLDRRHHVYVLEVNPNPDLTEGVSFMDAAQNAGMSFSETLAKIVEFARSRRPVG